MDFSRYVIKKSIIPLPENEMPQERLTTVFLLPKVLEVPQSKACALELPFNGSSPLTASAQPAVHSAVWFISTESAGMQTAQIVEENCRVKRDATNAGGGRNKNKVAKKHKDQKKRIKVCPTRLTRILMLFWKLWEWFCPLEIITRRKSIFLYRVTYWDRATNARWQFLKEQVQQTL